MPTEPRVDERPRAATVPETYQETLRRLRAAQKPAGRGAPAYSVYVNRRLGRFIAAAAYRAGLTPNQVTAISATLTFAAVLLLALVPPTFWLGLAVTVLLAAGYAFDSADGQLARLRGGGSAAGEWLDHVVDAIKSSTLHAAVLITAYRFLVPTDQRTWLLVPLGFMAVAAVSFSVFLLNDLLKAARAGRDTTSVIRTGSTPLRSLAGAPTDYGVLVFVFLLLGAPAAFAVVYTLLFAAHLGYLLLALPKWFRDMRALDPAA
ncbi:CDP-alcohol phosphatidyltransferase family protein [Amnibacterium kyonggiense]|uniref:CDP-alcohol phosphatidyltransferase-like enzyme n=1 Tax=Amnibacterium kyonggiense TaxID=595671 RepID=A0A4R7FFH2_9MICO|nr:CDP-alcohol phosphatidyltransferase family protein [Amnibacterium kyonggiense]TDS74941.1 CDP-alcohol phosphatidyltransferase-like enzyme [Amnibacterium kyonggiense]